MGRHRRSTRALAIPAVVAALLLVGSGSAWAWWSTSSPRSASGAAAVLPAPVVDASCNPRSNLQNDPVTVSWPAVPSPPGATVQYRVTFVSDNGTVRSFPSATTTTTATSLDVLSTQLGSTTTDRNRTQTITVQTFAAFPGVTWTSLASAPVQAHGETILAWTDMHCS
jgi:hypothetical protein